MCQSTRCCILDVGVFVEWMSAGGRYRHHLEPSFLYRASDPFPPPFPRPLKGNRFGRREFATLVHAGKSVHGIHVMVRGSVAPGIEVAVPQPTPSPSPAPTGWVYMRHDLSMWH
jgi:hypothetical protein